MTIICCIVVLCCDRREIMALQKENYTLEKQMHKYQLAISRKNSKNGIDAPLLEPTVNAPGAHAPSAHAPSAHAPSAHAPSAHAQLNNGAISKADVRPSSAPQHRVRSSTPDARKSHRRDRSRDRRRLPPTDVTGGGSGVDVVDRYDAATSGNHVTNSYSRVANNVNYDQYADSYSDRRPSAYSDDVNTYAYDEYSTSDMPAYGKDQYRDDYANDYQYYSDKYSKTDFAPTAQAKYYGDAAGGYAADPYAKDASTTDPHAPKYWDPYGANSHVADAAAAYDYAADPYPSDVPVSKDRYGARKSSDGKQQVSSHLASCHDSREVSTPLDTNHYMVVFSLCIHRPH